MQRSRKKWLSSKSAIVLKNGKADLTFYHLGSVTLSLSNDVEQKWNKLWRCAPVIDHYKSGHDCKINFARTERGARHVIPNETTDRCRRTQNSPRSTEVFAVGGTESFQFRRRAKQLCRLATWNWMANKRLGSNAVHTLHIMNLDTHSTLTLVLTNVFQRSDYFQNL